MRSTSTSPWTAARSFIPVLEEMESMGLTVHFRLLLLDRIEERCCGETSAVRFCRILGRCAGGNIVTMGTLELKLRDRVLKRAMDIAGRPGGLHHQHPHHRHHGDPAEAGKPRSADL